MEIADKIGLIAICSLPIVVFWKVLKATRFEIKNRAPKMVTPLDILLIGISCSLIVLFAFAAIYTVAFR